VSLKPKEVTDAIASGIDQKISDGSNLYLVVRNGRGFWVYQFRDGKVTRSKGLGSAATVTPAQARRAREDFVVARRSGVTVPAATLTPAASGLPARPLSAAAVPAGKSFTILTAARSCETVKGERSQIDGATWICPGSIMKEGKEHRVPLSAEALALIGDRPAGRLFESAPTICGACCTSCGPSPYMA